MQKWLPEAFPEDDVIVGVAAPSRDFEAATQDQSPEKADNWSAALFRGESGFSDPRALLSHLTPQEKLEIRKQIEAEVAAEQAAKEANLAAEFAVKLEAQQEQHAATFAAWCRNFEQAMAAQLAEIGAASAKLAVQLAERIIRSRVPLDPGILTRGIETALFKIVDGSAITITVNPDDARYFQDNSEALNHLPVKEIKEDRRIERGGCLLQAGNLEWDATLASQMEALSQVVEEAVAVTKTAPDLLVHAPAPQKDGEADGPGVD